MALLFPVGLTLKHSHPEASDATFQVSRALHPTLGSEPQSGDWQSQKKPRRLIQESWWGEQGFEYFMPGFEGLNISCLGRGLCCELVLGSDRSGNRGPALGPAQRPD